MGGLAWYGITSSELEIIEQKFAVYEHIIGV